MKYNFYPFNFSGAILTKDNKAVVETSLGHLCGYVALHNKAVPKAWQGNYDADALQYLNIHGGITYCQVRGNYTVFGLDCAHAGDEENVLFHVPAHVMKLTEQMESQLLLYKSKLKEWRKAPRDRRIEIMDNIRESADMQEEMGCGALIGVLAGGTEFGGPTE